MLLDCQALVRGLSIVPGGLGLPRETTREHLEIAVAVYDLIQREYPQAIMSKPGTSQQGVPEP